MTTEFEWVRLERTFDAKAETVWKLWTEAELFKRWYGPNGMNIPVAEMDVVIGGKRKICMEMQMPEKTMTMWFVGEYKEIKPHQKLVYTESMADENGNVLSPDKMGMPASHPETTEVVVELSEKDGKTTVRLTHIGVPATSGGAGGWSQALEKMEALVSSGAI